MASRRPKRHGLLAQLLYLVGGSLVIQLVFFRFFHRHLSNDESKLIPTTRHPSSGARNKQEQMAITFHRTAQTLPPQDSQSKSDPSDAPNHIEREREAEKPCPEQTNCVTVFRDIAGPKFDGIGAISGGGATSRLLIDYPHEQRKQILDALFLPGYGASLQALKVEIGGDGFSGIGAEPSHKRNQTSQADFSRGWQWWLMHEAKERNPNIRFHALPWSFPGYLSGDRKQLKFIDEKKAASYVADWVGGAKDVHNFTIQTVGLWSGMHYTKAYVRELRKALTKVGAKSTKIAVDGVEPGFKSIAQDVTVDDELRAAVGVLSGRYPGTFSTEQAKQAKLPLWAGEEFSTDNRKKGAGCLARIINQNFVSGEMTATFIWNLVVAYHKGLPWPHTGLIDADEPWSGHYTLSHAIYAIAHTTQFAKPGWRYVPRGKGSGLLNNGGSYVTLVGPQMDDIVIVIEKMSWAHSKCLKPHLEKYHTEDETLKLQLGVGLKLQGFHIWRSCFEYQSDGLILTNSSVFERIEQFLHVTSGGSVSPLVVETDCVYTLSPKVGRQGKVARDSEVIIPSSAPFPVTYEDDFEFGSKKHGKEKDQWRPSSLPRFFTDINGAFEVRDTGHQDKWLHGFKNHQHDVQHGHVLQQVSVGRPVHSFFNDRFKLPITSLGDMNWKD
eukprot:gnl/MRDRNA2_/MRDRNA2_27179_c0_seq1.p1 gnl/MRDRNA2_/MRDRNA2_27179_c0~~gnl/MRDRNA2_/MRDRNA2_27179_c0_seq1.p1  ORF type:complete len:666 (+),score=107.79 gnl/MRDRNA2_/MRDRNA2_27179_c0_seq1:276-2273(+)